MNIKGYTTSQAEVLLEQYGENVIDEAKPKSLFWVFFDQLNNFLVILLLGAAVVSFIVGEQFDAILILSIVVLNAFFGIYQEKKASNAIAALKKMTVLKVRVVRDSKEIEIDSRFLVPGDVFFVEEGSKVPADAVVIEPVNLEVNESALTGESLSITKAKGDQIFMGTIVSKGRAYAEVEATGMDTKFGEIAAHLSQIEEAKTPLQKKLENISKIIGLLGLAVSAVVFVLTLAEGSSYLESFLLAVSLSVAVVPEGLPAIMTITLALGVKEMAKRKAIVRKLAAIEALGSITLIATDKTGTLTQNKMNVKKIYLNTQEYDSDKLPTLMDPAFSKLVVNGTVCSTASLVKVHDHHGHYDVLGDPTEGALLYLAHDVGLDIDMTREQWKLLDEDPFESTTKTMSVLVKHNNQMVVFRKGALESILAESSCILSGTKKEKLTDEKRKEIEEKAEEWAGKGLRILAFSFDDTSVAPLAKKLHGAKAQDAKPEYEVPPFTSSPDGNDMVFIGMVGIHDPPRPESRDAILRARRAGIKTVMITGDNEKTAEAIATGVGLLEEGDEILTGKQIEEYSDEELLKKLPQVKIFARTTPFHKSRIVKLYQKMGEIVAVTGDGVNDAIALKQADVGIAMGRVGTDVARETADMVITDDNFATIVNAVEEGRSIVRNLTNSVKYLLTGNLSEALSLVIAIIIGIPHLFYPIQILYTNLVSDGFPALAVAFSPREEGIMKRPPNKQSEILSSFDKKYIGIVGFIGSLLVLLVYFIFTYQGYEEIARTAAFCMLVCMQSFLFIDIWLDHRSMRRHLKKSLSIVFFLAFLITFGIQYIIVSIPVLAKIFKVQPISLPVFMSVILLASVYIFFIKGVKLIVKPQNV